MRKPSAARAFRSSNRAALSVLYRESPPARAQKTKEIAPPRAPSRERILLFIILLVGTFVTVLNVGFNEWGHPFWVLDEGFASPLRLGFAFFGSMALGCFGVALQILARLRQLMGPECVAAVARRCK